MGFRTRAVALAQKGIPPREIINHVPVAIDTIYGYLREARREGADIPNFKPPGRRPIGPRLEVSGYVTDALTPHADRRGLTIPALIHALLETIARDDMVNAVLDDQPKTHARKGANHV